MGAVAIIGAGQAAAQCAVSLRQDGFDGAITLFGDEPEPPYQRPPLSKAYLLGKSRADQLSLRPDAFWTDNAISVRTATRVAAIDRSARKLVLADGASVAFDHLVIATGARNRPLPVPGANQHNVLALRTLADARTIGDEIRPGMAVVVIGGGFIGLEFAAVARQLGCDVSVVEVQSRLMARAVGATVSDYFRDLHQTAGVNVLLGASVAAIDGQGDRASAVQLADGRTLPADLVVYGIGVIPNSELARDAGIACDNGILVDGAMRSNDPTVLAIGDVARHHNRFCATGEMIRLESVQNAIDQGKVAAATLLGRVADYNVAPWFWSDQFDTKLQTVGLANGHDQAVLRGDRAAQKFSVFYFREGRLIAIDSINSAADHMIGRRVLASGAALTAGMAADSAFDLRSLAR